MLEPSMLERKAAAEQQQADLQEKAFAAAVEIDERTRPTRNWEARMKAAQERYDAWKAIQDSRPVVVDETRLRFWESVRQQAEAQGIPFEMPTIEAVPEPAPESEPVTLDPHSLRAKFEAAVLSGQE